MYASIEFSVIALNRNQIVKILLILLFCFIVARTLYENISGKFLLFLIVVEYLLTYSLSFAVGMLATSVCGMDAQTFQADKDVYKRQGLDGWHDQRTGSRFSGCPCADRAPEPVRQPVGRGRRR